MQCSLANIAVMLEIWTSPEVPIGGRQIDVFQTSKLAFVDVCRGLYRIVLALTLTIAIVFELWRLT